MEDKIISYKGTDSKMQCRGMQYEVGKEFSVDGDIECCGNGLHACERPLDVFGYYAPGTGARYIVWGIEDGIVCASFLGGIALAGWVFHVIFTALGVA